LELALVDDAAMGDLDDQDRQPLILDTAKHSEVSNAIAPQAGKLVEQRLSEISGIR